MDDILTEFGTWFEAVASATKDSTPKGTIAGALVVLERLRAGLEFDINAYIAPGGAQIAGASGAAVARILRRYGETRTFAREGGRTNRGLIGHMRDMLSVLGQSGLAAMSESARSEALDALQAYLVERVREFHNRQRLAPVFDPGVSMRYAISELLKLARLTGKEGPVAQYLVGAKLAVRHPGIAVGNESYSTADVQLGRVGDFKLGDTAFHVTVAPMPPVYDKCRANVLAGLRAFLLVPDRALIGARQIMDQMLPGKVAVESLESFIGQNIEELAEHSQSSMRQQVRRLFETYNARVDAVETDKSLMIEMPPNL